MRKLGLSGGELVGPRDKMQPDQDLGRELKWGLNSGRFAVLRAAVGAFAGWAGAATHSGLYGTAT